MGELLSLFWAQQTCATSDDSCLVICHRQDGSLAEFFIGDPLTDEVGEENAVAELVVVVEWVRYVLRQGCCDSVVRRGEESVTRLLICNAPLIRNEKKFINEQTFHKFALNQL